MTRILIADDHDVVRSGVRAVLEAQAGWEVVGEAGDGKDAVSQALTTRPDVVVLDYSLPVLNGIEATRQIVPASRAPKCLSSRCTTAAILVREVLEAGAKGFLLKSDARKFLIAAVESLAAHQPFFTGKVSETLLETYLAKGTAGIDVDIPREVDRTVDRRRSDQQADRRVCISLKTVETHRPPRCASSTSTRRPP